MQHVVQEAHARPDPNLLAGRHLARVRFGRLVLRRLGAVVVGERLIVGGKEFEQPAVDGERYLDFRLGCVARYVGCAAGAGWRSGGRG